jgi:ubiquinone/menaquinone biosynthesis C-methylase UbiE
LFIPPKHTFHLSLDSRNASAFKHPRWRRSRRLQSVQPVVGAISFGEATKIWDGGRAVLRAVRWRAALETSLRVLRKVDQAADPRFFIEFLDARRTIEGEREVNQLILEMLDLKPGAQVLDVGCGTGDDVREIAELIGATGRIVGIDPSDALIAESKRPAVGSSLPVEFVLGDVRKLDLPNAAFDRVRTDRVLMFVPEIQTAIAEMVRVLRPGGRLVASELDQQLWFIDSRLPEINRKIHAAWVASNPQPCLGRQLARLFADQGLWNVKSTPRVIRAPHQMFTRVTGGFLNAAIARGDVTQIEVDAWLSDLAKLAEAGVFTHGVVTFTARGENPA